MSNLPSRSVAVVTPWYPTADAPFAGAFVQAMVEATAPGCDELTVYHTEGWRVPDDSVLPEALEAYRTLLPRALRPEATVAGAEVWRVPVSDPIPTGGSFAERARLHADWLREALGREPLPAAVVHAHVGLRGGWTALENARPDARVFVTEHASYLGGLLEQPDSRDLYEQVLDRCTGMFAVGDQVRDTLAKTFPQHADKVRLIPNPVSFDQPRPRPVTELRRWLYVGNLTEHKGVHLLLEAFADCRAEDPDLTLTVVGSGKLARPLAARVTELGLGDAVTMKGALPPDETLRLMRDHDLLVHPSRGETFGMSIVEAVAAGLPVLVTRCGGPEATLTGVQDAAGQMIDVNDDPGTIAAGYRSLRERFPRGLDLAEARRVLDERFGYGTVAEAHHRHWFNETAMAAGGSRA